MAKPQVISNIINHIVFVIDESSSMSGLRKQVVDVFDGQIARLAQRSQELDQETRVSVYLFSYAENIRCIVYDKDVLRLPSLAGHYSPNGMTALLDATTVAIDELAQTAELHGEHSFLVYSITDGMENVSSQTPRGMGQKIAGLPSHWTVAVFVPDQNGVEYAKRCGFPEENVSQWNVGAKGLQDMGDFMFRATDNFMQQRAQGVRGTRALFAFDTRGITKQTVRETLDALSKREYKELPVKAKDDSMTIRDFVEAKTKQKYRAGSAYYELSKRETIQSRKNICIRENSTGKVFTGAAVRQMLGLPDHEVRVNPADHDEFTFFVQSTSWNRKLKAGTEVLVLA